MQLVQNHRFHAALFTVAACTGLAEAHGPVIPLNVVNGQLVTGAFNFSPVKQSASAASTHPFGAASRVFPSQYAQSTYDYVGASTYADGSAKTPQTPPSSTLVIPMVYTSYATGVTGNSGFYGQLEPKDGNGSATLGTGPGYAYGGVPANTLLRITFADTLKSWNGSAFAATPGGELLQMVQNSGPSANAYVNALTSPTTAGSTDTALGNGVTFSTGAAPTAGSHSQLAYRLTSSTGNSTNAANDIADGLYLAAFRIGTDTTSTNQYATSLPYYVLFEKNVGGTITAAQEQAAVNYINSTVPEPASLALIGIGGAGLLTRRRRA